MNTIEELELELIATTMRMHSAEMQIEELQEELDLLKSHEPYGTVVHYRNNVSTFYPWSEGMPCFDNAIERKIVYLA